MAIEIPKNVLDLLSRPDSVKIVVTANKAGVPHAIVCGSVFSPDPKTLAVGEILMKVSSKNMKENPNVSILVTKGTDAFIVKTKVITRAADGEILGGLNKNLAKMNMKASAVWLFEALEVYDESAGPNAGKKLA